MIHFGPEVDPEPAEVHGKTAGLRVAPIQLAAPNELSLYEMP